MEMHLQKRILYSITENDIQDQMEGCKELRDDIKCGQE
jgi:hypothetical protein